MYPRNTTGNHSSEGPILQLNNVSVNARRKLKSFCTKSEKPASCFTSRSGLAHRFCFSKKSPAVFLFLPWREERTWQFSDFQLASNRVRFWF